MNKVILMGRLTRDPEVRYSQGNNSMAIARYTIAVDRRQKKDGDAEADFIPCVVFGKQAEFAEKYFHQGIKILVTGRITTGSYTNKDGNRVYTTEVTVEDQEFTESKNSNGGSGGGFSGGSQNGGFSSGGFSSGSATQQSSGGGFMNVPDDEELPFN